MVVLLDFAAVLSAPIGQNAEQRHAMLVIERQDAVVELPIL